MTIKEPVDLFFFHFQTNDDEGGHWFLMEKNHLGLTIVG